MPLILPVALLVEATIVYIVFANICKISLKKREIVLIVLGMSVGVFVAFLIIPIAQLAQIISNTLYIAVLLYASYRKLKKFALCVFYAIFSTIIALLASSLASAVLVFVLNLFRDYLETELFLMDWELYIPLAIITFSLAFVFSFVAGKVFNKKIETLDDSQRKYVGSFLALGSLVTLVPFWTFAFFWEFIFVDPLSPLMAGPLLVFFFAFVGLTLMSFTNRVRQDADLRIKDESLKAMQDYTRKIETMASEVRGFRHDHYNLLLGFTEYIAEEDLDGLRAFHESYLEAFEDETKLMHSRRLDTLVNVTTPALKSLYIAKIMYAQQLKIDVRIDTRHEIEKIDENILVDLCRVIGVFLDNAIEACADNPDSVIELGIANTPNGVLFIFENTYKGSVDISKIFERGYSTKGCDRGIGLQTVMQIISKNEALTLKTTLEDERFIQLLTVHTH